MRLLALDELGLTAQQRELSKRISERRGRTGGPFLVWLRAPELCECVEALGSYARFDAALTERQLELMRLTTARHWDSEYSWNAHYRRGTAAGLPADALDAIARGDRPTFEARDERVLYAFCAELLETHLVSDTTFAEALELFGSRALVDIVGALGSFSMLGMCLNAFELNTRPEDPSPFPDIHGYHHRGESM